MLPERVDPSIAFYEEQQMREPLILIPTVVGDILTLVFVVVMFPYFKQQEYMIPAFIALFVLAAASGWFMFCSKMKTEVGQDGFTIANPLGFLKRTIPFDQIRNCGARTYSPLKEYGGWGVKGGPGGKAYTMMGNRGVQLELTSGEKLLIGSQRADELAALIQARMK